jgi:hypothetical protein
VSEQPPQTDDAARHLTSDVPAMPGAPLAALGAARVGGVAFAQES